MTCDVCKSNPSTVQMMAQVNGHKQSVKLCDACYAHIRQGAAANSGSVNPFGMPFGPSSFGELFSGLFQDVQNQMAGKSNNWQTRAGQGSQSGNQGGGFLDQFGRNLSELASQGRIDPVIGRQKEIARVIEVLNRRNKNNPVLIGEPGVGKTAIAEGLALAIVEENVPQKLRGKRVYSLDVASLVADTGIRGQFEERMKQLIQELEAQSDIILFIDEIHLLVGAGSAQGSMDAGNILKPALARGDVQVIGATTLKEYRQIEKDAALERRFQPVTVHEPTPEEAIRILQGLQTKYESYHQVKFTDDALAACVTLSKRYIADRYLPDKAIDLMDEAGSKANLKSGIRSSDDLKGELTQVIREKEQATQAEAYERAAELRQEELRLRMELESANGAQETPTMVEVTAADIEAIVEEKTGVPVQKLQSTEQSKLRDLELTLSSRVIGQQNAVQKVAKAVRRSRLGLRKGERPIGSFLFVGPTGVGKTELAKSLAAALFGSKDSMIRLDMSEFMEKHSVAKLIGSPPGYVGYEEAGQLTEQVRRNPYSLLLLDEIEKAHPDVQHMFLQIMEDGRLTDSQGRTVSFKDTIIIMTSNAGVFAKQAAVVGFQASNDSPSHESRQEAVIEQLASYFKPEFLNRFEAIVEFNSLTKEHLNQIVRVFLEELRDIAKERGVTLTWSEGAVTKLGEVGHHPLFGARPLRRVIQDEVEDRMADFMVNHEDCQKLHVDVEPSGAFIVTE